MRPVPVRSNQAGQRRSVKRRDAQLQPALPRWPVWRHYCALLRFRYHISFVLVVVGMVTATRMFTLELLGSAAALYVSFNILLYGGIYTLHAASDAQFDRLHASKFLRPIASGAIPLRHAHMFGTTLLMSGLITGYALFPKAVVNFYAAAILLNAFYSGIARRVPYLEIAANAVTHPLRFQMGVALAGGTIAWRPLLLTFLVAAGASTLRRRVELERGGTAGRPVLAVYSVPALIGVEVALWLAIGALWIFDPSALDMYYVVAAISYAALVLLPEICLPLRLGWQRYWSA